MRKAIPAIVCGFCLLFSSLPRTWAQGVNKSKPEAPTVVPCPDPLVHQIPLAIMSPDPNRPAPTKISGTGFWQLHYHAKVNTFIFELLYYPYYGEGKNYLSSGPGYKKLFPPAAESPAEVPAIPISAAASLDTQAEPNQIPALDTANAASQGAAPPAANPEKLYQAAVECCDLIYQWRKMNESPATALEIVLAVEMTKVDTDIYIVKPELAVLVKRILGRVGQLNRQFDETSRLTLGTITAGKVDKSLLQHLHKILADIDTLLSQLIESNDAMSTALGAGKINREVAWPKDADIVNYAELHPLAAPGRP